MKQKMETTTAYGGIYLKGLFMGYIVGEKA